MKKAILAAAVAFAASGAFAQAVQSSTDVAVTSGTGVVVTPGVPAQGVLVSPGIRTVEAVPTPTIDGAVVAQAGTQEIVNGNTRTVVTRYWVNVPRGANVDDEFERWQRLR